VDVLINNAGGSLKRLRPTAMLNFVAAGILLEHYCTTMQGGHIITISSNAAYGAEAYNCGYSEMPMQRIAYCAAKRAVKFLSNALSRAHPTVKITSLEPGRVGGKSAVQYKDIPRIIQWVLEQNFQVNTLNFVPKP
jgi:NAD(P)-dependent dehydrogenase (short-subunit alcohol dehydrogenase family)